MVLSDGTLTMPSSLPIVRNQDKYSLLIDKPCLSLSSHARVGGGIESLATALASSQRTRHLPAI